MMCGKKVEKMKPPFEQNYKGGVDVLLYPHYGSRHIQHNPISKQNTSKSVVPIWVVICDDCIEESLGDLSDKEKLSN